MKISTSKKKSGVGVIVNYADTRFLTFAIEYLRENKFFLAKPFLPIHLGPRSNLLSRKKMIKNSRDSVPLKPPKHFL